MIENLIGGFALILSLKTMAALVAGVALGYVAGAIPGLTSSIAMALLIPFTFGMDAVSAMVMLVTLYIAADYAGAIPAILVNAPGQPAAAVTAFDGYPMRQRGEVGKALTLSILSSGVGALVGTIFLIFSAVWIANAALAFGPSEFFALAVLGLSLVGVLSSGLFLKGFIGLLFGLLIVTIGLDPMTGNERYVLTWNLLEGIPLLPALIGLFAFSEVLMMMETAHRKAPEIGEVPKLTLSFGLFRGMSFTLARSSVIGYLVGVVPGAGSTIASLVSYGEAKRAARDPDSFGKGNPEGVVAAEAANNAACPGALAPLLALGVPGSASTAVLIGALMVQGINPGPLLFVENPEIPYAVFAALLLGLPVMLLLGLFGVRYWVKLTLIPPGLLASGVAGVCVLGAYTNTNGMYPVWIMLGFGVAGYLMRKVDIHPAPVVLALVLGDMMETNFRRALIGGAGDPMVLVNKPIAAVLLGVTLLVILAPIVRALRARSRASAEAAVDQPRS